MVFSASPPRNSVKGNSEYVSGLEWHLQAKAWQIS